MIKLNKKYQLREEDQTLFNFEEAKLLEFNDTGFSMLLKFIKNNNEKISEEEKEFLNKLLNEKILIEE